MDFSSAQCYDFQCRVRSSCSEIRKANLQFQKRNVCMECVCVCVCVCLNLNVHDHIRCIVKVCISQLFWCREVTHNTKVVALRCEAIFA